MSTAKIDVTGDKEAEQAWDKELLRLKIDPDYMQSSAWAQSKLGGPWHPTRLKMVAGKHQLPIQVFSRSIPGLGKLHYAPQVTGVMPAILPELTKQVRDNYRGLAFKLSPYMPNSEELTNAFKNNGWKIASDVQYRHTVIVDLSPSHDEILASFKKRARYEIRVAEKNKIKTEKVEASPENLKTFYNLITVTADRSGAFFRNQDYLTKYWQLLSQKDQGSLYFAWYGKTLVAGAFVIKFGKNAWYKDGGSTREHADKMGSRLLQWQIMQDLKAEGIIHYDLCGVSSPEQLETGFMKGVYIFKTAFSRKIDFLMPTFELPLSKKYALWPKTEPQLLRIYSKTRKDYWY